MIRTFVDDRDAQRKIARLSGRFARFDHTVVERIEQVFVDFAKLQFQTRGRAGGNRWKNLRPETVKTKTRKGTYSRGVLRDTLAMYHMLTDKSSEDREWRQIPRGAQVIFKLGYFGVHQDGDPSHNLPQREVYPDPLPETMMSRIRNIVSGYYIGGFA